MFGLFSYTLLPDNCSPFFFSDAKFFMLTYSNVWFLALVAISNGLSFTVLPLSLAIVAESALPDILLFNWMTYVLLIICLGWEPPLLFNRCWPLEFWIVSLSNSSWAFIYFICGVWIVCGPLNVLFSNKPSLTRPSGNYILPTPCWIPFFHSPL